jgi:predicted nucleic acid-binding protein
MERNNKMEIIIDANVVVKWFVVEEFKEQAISLRDDYINNKIELSAPVILPFEVLNAIFYSKKGISNIELENIGKSLLYYGIKLFPMNEKLLLETVDIALKMNITIYDAVYVSLAKIRNSNLFTADSHLINKLDDLTKTFVRHISTYQSQSNNNRSI